MVSCSVATCKNYYRKTKGGEISYYCFPKDPKVCKVWVTRCKRKEKLNPATSRICSNHFKPDDFTVNLKNELLNIPYKKPLKHDAVPSLFLSPGDNEDSHTTTAPTTEYTNPSATRKSRTEAREIRKRALERLRTLSPKRTHFDIECNSPTTTAPTTEDTNPAATRREIRERALERLRALSPKRTHFDKECNTDYFPDPEKIKLTADLKTANTLIAKLTRNLHEAKRKNEVQDQKLKQLSYDFANYRLKNWSKRAKRIENLTFEVRFTNLLKDIFTKGQIKCLLRGGKRVKWDQEDIKSASELRSLSNKVYKHLKKKGFPLPGRSTLQARLKKSEVEIRVPESNETISNIVADGDPPATDVGEITVRSVVSDHEYSVNSLNPQSVTTESNETKNSSNILESYLNSNCKIGPQSIVNTGNLSQSSQSFGNASQNSLNARKVVNVSQNSLGMAKVLLVQNFDKNRLNSQTVATLLKNSSQNLIKVGSVAQNSSQNCGNVSQNSVNTPKGGTVSQNSLGVSKVFVPQSLDKNRLKSQTVATLLQNSSQNLVKVGSVTQNSSQVLLKPVKVLNVPQNPFKNLKVVPLSQNSLNTTQPYVFIINSK